MLAASFLDDAEASTRQHLSKQQRKQQNMNRLRNRTTSYDLRKGSPRCGQR